MVVNFSPRADEDKLDRAAEFVLLADNKLANDEK
jgi:hypothetical protein